MNSEIYTYSVYQFGYELKHLESAMQAVGETASGSTRKELSLIKHLAEQVKTKFLSEFDDAELNEVTRKSLLDKTLHEFVKHMQYRVYSVGEDGMEQVEIFDCEHPSMMLKLRAALEKVN